MKMIVLKLLNPGLRKLLFSAKSSIIIIILPTCI